MWIHYTGVAVNTPAGDMTSRAILLNASVDLPARAMISNMKQWNGAHGCLYCEDQGTTVGGDHLHRYWPYRDAVSRSHASLLRNAEMATRIRDCVCMHVHAVSSMLSLYSNISYEQVCGVKGPSVLALHPTFNLVWGIVIDDLHGIFLGVTLTLLHLWLDKTNKTKPFFIGNKVHIHIHVFVISVHLVKLCDYLNVSASVCDKLFR